MGRSVPKKAVSLFLFAASNFFPAAQEPLRNNMAIYSISLRLLIPLKGVLKRVLFRAFLWPCYFFTTA
jgi:hypothetical protein